MRKYVTIIAAFLFISLAYSQRTQRTVSTSRTDRGTSVQPSNQTRTASTSRTTTRSANTSRTSTRSAATVSSSRTTSSTRTARPSATTRSASTSVNTTTRSNRPSTRTVTTTRTTTTRTTSAQSGRSSHHTPSRSTRNTSYRAVAVSVNRPTRAVSHSYRYHSHHEYRPLPKHRTIHVHHYRPVEVVYHFTPKVRVRYCNIYPHIDFSVYPVNYRIPTISAYKARYYKGSLASVYGVVKDVHYSRDYDEYYLYVGQYYPRHDFCVVMPGYLAREYSRHPGSYFRDYEVMVTGQISHYSGKPEMVIKTHSQLDVFQFHAYVDHGHRYHY